MEIVYMAVMGLVSLVSFIIFIMVLIKSFKEGGALHGIIGLLTCGLYTFIWGWLKHKDLQLTKTMLLWSLLVVLSFALPLVIGTGQVMQMVAMGTGGQTAFLKGDQKSSKRSVRQARSKARRRTAAAKNKRARRSNNAAQKKKAPRTDMEWNAEAVSLWKNGQYTNASKAVSYLGRAIQKNPNFADAYNNRGNAYRDLKQFQMALNDYNKAIQLQPNFPKALNNRGNIHFDQNKYQQAINDYNKSITINPSYSTAYLNRGLAYQKLKKTNLACNDFQKACQLGDCDGLNWARKNNQCK